MRPDQERVKNLLIDTVTLLCKNSVQFQDELHVEGLLGVSVDKKDVFFVHISKEFSNSPSDGATVTQTNTDSQDEDIHPTENSRGSDDTHRKDNTCDNQEIGQISIKTEAIERPEEKDECLIVEDPNVKLEGRVSPAHMIAGQRRVGKRASPSDSQHYAGDGSMHSAYGMGSSSGYGQSQFSGMGEPPSKRRTDSQEDDYLPEDGDDTGGTPWPSLAGTAGFDPSQAFQQDSDNSQISMDGSQPGCSSWSTPGRGPSDSGSHPSMYLGPLYISHLRNQHRKTSRYQYKRKFPCPVCKKMFPSPSNLELHLRSHTGEKPYPCEYCGKKFSEKGNRKRHYRTVHSVIEEEEEKTLRTVLQNLPDAVGQPVFPSMPDVQG